MNFIKEFNVICGTIYYWGISNKCGVNFLMIDTEIKLVAQELEYRLEFEKLITIISINFINLPIEDIDKGISNALKSIGNFTNVDRSCVFLLSDNKQSMNNSHEWCAEGITPQIDNLQGIPVNALPWWMNKLTKLETIKINKVKDLPFGAANEKAILEEQDIQSVILVPMVHSGTLIGFLGLYSVRQEKHWTEETIALIKLVGKMFVNALQRKWTEEELRKSGERLRLVTDNMLDMLCLTDPDLKIQYATPAFERFLGFSNDELIGKLIFDLVHPEDLQHVLQAVDTAFNNKTSGKAVFRYQHANGNFVWFESYGNLIIGANGEIIGATFVNRDITERKRAEEELQHYTRELKRSNEELQMKNFKKLKGIFTEREIQVLERLEKGLSNKDIAEMLSVSPNTIKRHLNNMFNKLTVSTRTELLAKCYRLVSENTTIKKCDFNGI
jgi:PAS domain S-box-containing protein